MSKPPPRPQQSCIHNVTSVLVAAPVDKAYSYEIPLNAKVSYGDYVSVPLGSRIVSGVVWESDQPLGTVKTLKSIAAYHSLPGMPETQRRFIDRVADYTMAPKGAVLKMALSVRDALDEPDGKPAYIAAPDAQDHPGLTPQRRAVLDALAEGGPRRAAQLARDAGCSPAVISGMVKLGLLQQITLDETHPATSPQHHLPGPTLTPVQAAAAYRLSESVRDRSFRTILLDGVTGAGKTEVYFEAVREALDMGRQVLILLPEIALTNAFIDRFTRRFGEPPALWHSSLSPARRRTTWRGVVSGATRVVAGARSALFLPYADLGLIIVDEEHDSAYKQEDGVLYHARDMAVLRASIEKIPVLLVSATPSLETAINAWQGRYLHVELEGRHGSAGLPEIRIIDLRAHTPPRQKFLSAPLIREMTATLERGEQSLLFLNRRGYAPLTLCRSCGHRLECPHCTAWLVEHRKSPRLTCHHCGHTIEKPERCPSCQDTDSFSPCGPGVERILEEVQEHFPDARIAMLASDTTDDPTELAARLADVRDHKVDIVVGTQIIAKGHHFPKLTLVGVVDADLGLAGGDLRASERTFQLLHQVSGRAGREDKPGIVMLQTWMPEHRVIQALAAQDRETFLRVESEERKAARMPPFTRLAAIILSGPDESKLAAAARRLGSLAPHGEGLVTLGPAPAPLYRLRGLFRYRFLIQAEKTINVQKTIAHWLAEAKLPSTIQVRIDIDPQSFL